MSKRLVLRADHYFWAAVLALISAVSCQGQRASGNPLHPNDGGADAAADLDAASDADAAADAGGASDADAGLDSSETDCTGSSCTSVPCNVTSCPLGCCDASGACQAGASTGACGLSGHACEDCNRSGAVCQAQQCAQQAVPPVCNAQNCPSGCCDGNVCQLGVTGVACGGSGTSCRNCLAISQICSGQQCIDDPGAGASCDQNSCTDGCCDDKGHCLSGLDAASCGIGGRRCVDCTAPGSSCLLGTCTGPNGTMPCAASCDGCCDPSGACQAGFTDAQCGQLGRACVDCTALTPASTCDVNIAPRTCVSLQRQCPGVYSGCPAALHTAPPVKQAVCAARDLDNAAAGCGGGPNTAGCNAFFNYEAAANPACVTCLQAFDFDFADETGIRLCVAAFVDATCNHASACAYECVREACYSCPDTPSTILCADQVNVATCASYHQGDGCVTTALGGPGAVCNPATYQQRFGDWLKAVGGVFCGM